MRPHARSILGPVLVLRLRVLNPSFLLLYFFTLFLSLSLSFVKGLPPIGYVVNLLIPPVADYHYPDVALSLVDANLTLPFCALNQNLFLIRSSNFPQTAPIVRTKFDLNPEQEWTQAQEVQTINL